MKKESFKKQLKQLFSKEKIKSFLHVCIGVFIAAFAYSFFLKPNDLVIGGVSGIGVMVQDASKPWLDSLIMYSINMGLLIIALIFVGKEFVIKTLLGASLYPLFTFILDLFYVFLNDSFTMEVTSEITGITEMISVFDFSRLDMMLVIVFSSIIMGFGLGYAMRYGGSTGGTEVGQMILYKKLHLPYSLTLYLIDGTVIITGFFILRQTLDYLLYEIIFAVVCGVVMDIIIFGGLNKRGVYIITKKYEEIKRILLDDFQRGVTGIRVVGEYSNNETKMILCVLSTIEYNRLRDIVEDIDPDAFYFCVRASEVRGEGFSHD